MRASPGPKKRRSAPAFARSHNTRTRRDGPGGLAHFLGAAGFDIWLADLRHHGDSAREPRRGAWTFEDWVLHDTPTLVARVREETDGAPLVWLGHSAGGAAGLWVRAAEEAKPAA